MSEKDTVDISGKKIIAESGSALDLSSLGGFTPDEGDHLNVSSLSPEAALSAEEKSETVGASKDENIVTGRKDPDGGRSSDNSGEALFKETVFMLETGAISEDMGISLLSESASKDCVDSLIYLGKLYSDGGGKHYSPDLAFENFSHAARLGSGEGCYYLGLCYANGIGCQKNLSRAEAMFSRGGELDHAESFLALGICRERGIGCEIDYPMAVKLYAYAAGLGRAEATNNLGGCYFYGHGIEQDKWKAAQLYQRAAEMGSANALCRLGICFEEGEGVERDECQAFKHYTSAAEAENTVATYRLALCYDNGIGTEQNFAQAFKCYMKSAKAGYPLAMYKAGLMCKNGRGTRKNENEAYRLFTLAAEAGHSPSVLEVGNCFFDGVGTVRNLESAFTRYKNAYSSDENNAEASFKLGLCYLKGLGTKKDPVAAFEWFSKSADTGSRDAAYMLGECYYYGVGVAENKALAVKAFEKVAMEDESDGASIRAFLALAYCFEHAVGTGKDIESALALYKKAAEYGSADAMYLAGRAIMHGAGDKSDHSMARSYILRAARNSFVPAMLTIGIFADDGRGVARNPFDAEKWYTRAVLQEIKEAPGLYDFPERYAKRTETQNDAKIEAKYRLGMILAHNDPTLRSYIKAFEYVASAASAGHEGAQTEIAKIFVHGGDLKGYYESPFSLENAVSDNGESTITKETLGDAMNKLGDAYFDGKALVDKDKSAAVRCYKIAAELGHVDASYNYGWCLRHGAGIKENDVEAVKWLKGAADRGNVNAAYSYGLCCEEGSGTGIKNKREARSYYRKAASAGHAEAAKRYIALSE